MNPASRKNQTPAGFGLSLVFVAMMVPGAVGIGMCNATLCALVSYAASPRDQGRVQGAAGALESLGRTMGPVWGNAVLQRFGEGAAYTAAAGLLVGAAGMVSRYHLPQRSTNLPPEGGSEGIAV